MNQAILFVVAVAIVISGCASQPTLQYEEASNGVQSLTLQKPLRPDQTPSFLVTPDGFEVRVFAAEPDIRNPIALAWDERGRLWVLESTDYPHNHMGQETGTDRITICEDTDGDGVADSFIRFAENQPLSTALMVVQGGALVGQAPHIVFMEDTDGDDRFDRKTPVLENAFGTFDSHAVMNNLKYGIDNHIWGAVGYSGMYEPGKAPPVGERTNQEYRTLPMGVFRFSRDGQHLEPIGRFNNNTWGLGIGEDNTIFGSTANNNHAVVVGIPLRYGTEQNVAYVQSHFLVEHSATLPLQQVDYRDGYTAAAGAFLYAGRRYPRTFWNALMVNEPTAHIVLAARMVEDGALFKERDGEVINLLASSDDWVAPVFSDIGPDENIWVADWYNPVIQHNPDGRGMRNQIWNANRGPGNAHLNPLRDTEHGRIYVVAYTGREGDNIASLDPGDGDALINGLKSTNQFWRLTAQRLIIENNHASLAPQLAALVQDEDIDELGLNTAAVHALWTLHGLNRIEAHIDVVQEALNHPSPAVRKAALQVLPATKATGRLLTDSKLFRDPNLNTRLSAVLRVIDLGDDADDALKTAAAAASEGGDTWILAAVDALTAPAEEETIPTPTAGIASAGSGMPTAFLTVNANPVDMVFQQTSLQAYEGQPIQLTFNNLHPELHNVILLEQGVDVNQFGEALTSYLADPKAVSTEYVPPSEKDKVLASTGILPLDGTVTITIPGLPAGEYTYLCTVPGHWMLMQGTLHIEPSS